jgi:hypothetical protein
MILSLFIILGGLVVASYFTGYFLLKYYPSNYDLKGIWAGLAPYHHKWPMYLWYVGEFLSCLGFISLTYFMWEVENDNNNNNKDENNQIMTTFYIMFLVSALFWMPLAIQGDRFYHLTIIVLFITSLSAIGLLVESLIIWNADSIKGWAVLPLALHTTFFDMVFWCWTWTPTPYTLLQSTSQRQFNAVDKYTTGDNNNTPPATLTRPLFIIEEEDSRIFNEP